MSRRVSTKTRNFNILIDGGCVQLSFSDFPVGTPGKLPTWKQRKRKKSLQQKKR